jgi:hypothetical protein
MELTVNENTYVLPEDSDAFLREVLPTSNPLLITWEVLDKEEKSGYLVAALRRLEDLNFIGDKAWWYQPLKFPRIARGIPVNFDSAPDEVKRAQVYWAAVIASDELYVNRRNNDACLSLGLIKSAEGNAECVPKAVKSLLHRWITSWRKV